MNLTGALSIASGGIGNINAQLALVSQNIANANTPGYAVEESTQESIVGNGIGLGVHTGPARRRVDDTLNDSLTLENATVSNLTIRQTALRAIDAVLGTVNQGNDIGSLLSA